MKEYMLDRIAFDRIIEGIWLTIIFVIPLLFNPQCMMAYYFVKSIALIIIVSLLLGCVIARLVLHPDDLEGFSLRKWIKNSPLQVAAIAMGLVWIVSTAFSIIPHKSIIGNLAGTMGMLPALSWITFFIIVSGQIRSRAQVFRAIYALLISTGIVSITGITQFIYPQFLPWFGYEGRVFSTDGNPLSLSGLLAITMPLTLAVIVLSWNDNRETNRGWIVTALLTALFIIQMVCTALAQYSITMLLFVIGVFVFFTLVGLFLRRRTTFILGILSLLMLAVVAVYLVLPLLFTSSPAILSDNPSESTVVAEQVGLPTLSIRVHVWRSAADTVIKSPQIPYYQDQIHFLRRLIGYGPETFIATSQLTFPDALKSLYTHQSLVISQPENHFLFLAATTGILGFCSFIGLLIAFFYVALKTLLSTQSRTTGILAAAFIAGGVQYCAYILFNPALITIEVAFWLIAALAVASARVDRAKGVHVEVSRDYRGKAISVWRKLIAAGIAAAIILVGMGVSLPPYLANIKVQESMRLWDAEPGKAMLKLEEAVRLQPEESYYYNFIGRLAFSMAGNDKSSANQLMQRGEDALLTAIQYEPQMAIWRYRLAEMQLFRAIKGDVGKMEQAIEHYRQANNLFPGNAVILNRQALALMIAGRYIEAESLLKQSLQADEEWVQTSFYEGLLQWNQGKEQSAGYQFVYRIDNKLKNVGYFIDFCTRARSYGQMENVRLALHNYVSTGDNDWNGWMLLGISDMYCNMYSEAVHAFERAAHLVPDQHAVIMAGIAEGALKNNPEDPDAGHRIAEWLMQRAANKE